MYTLRKLGHLFMFEGQNAQGVDRFADVALLEHLGDDGDGARAGAAGGAGDQQEGMCLVEEG